MSTQEAFTLVELMVVISLISILAVISIPAGYYWVENSRITSVKGDLTEALGRAKSAALRNQRVAVAGVPVAVICIVDTNRLNVLEGTVADVPACEDSVGTQLWSAELDSKVSVSSSGTAISCICFDNLGLLTTTMCAGCLAQPTITLAINDLDETIYIF